MAIIKLCRTGNSADQKDHEARISAMYLKIAAENPAMVFTVSLARVRWNRS